MIGLEIEEIAFIFLYKFWQFLKDIFLYSTSVYLDIVLISVGAILGYDSDTVID